MFKKGDKLGMVEDCRKFYEGDLVKVVHATPSDRGIVKVGEVYEVTSIDKDGDLVIDSADFGRWWLEPRQVEVVASTGGKALENAADEGTSIDVDKLIEAIKNYGWTVNETIAYLEGFKEGVNTL